MDRDKLIEVLKQKECPLGKITRNNIYDVTTELADFLIENGIGDITAQKHRADVAEEALLTLCVDIENSRREYNAAMSSPNGNWYSSAGKTDTWVLNTYNEALQQAAKRLEEKK